MLWEERTGPLYKQLEHHYDSPALWIAAMAEHRAIVKGDCRPRCLGARRDATASDQAYKRFSTGWDSLH